MSKLPSAETQLRTLKSDYKRLKAAFNEMQSERDQYRQRATKAEQEAKQWQFRFDTLLHRDEGK